MNAPLAPRGNLYGALASAAKLSALADRMDEVRHQADEYRARLERQGAEYWRNRDREMGR